VTRSFGSRVILGRARLLLNRAEDARRLVEPALAIAQRFRGSRAHALHLFGDLAAHPRQFDPEAGARYYAEALALADELKMRPLVAHCHLGLGALHRRAGDHDRAHAHLTTATTLYRDMAMRFWLAQAKAEVQELF
jgi:tetratricopeptide (TPR) repeat protein